MIRARGPQSGKSRTVVTVDESKHLFVILNGSNESFEYRDLPPYKGDDLCLYFLSVSFRERCVSLSPERFVTLVALFNISGRAIDDFQCRLVTGFVVVIPRTHSVVAKQHAPGLWIIFNQLFNDQADIEAGALPRNVDQIFTVNFFA